MPLKRLLVSRTDRAGDLTLTLPVFSALHHLLPDAHVTAHVRTYTAPLLRRQPGIHKLIIDDPTPGCSLFALALRFRQGRFDAAILVHPTVRAVLAAFLAGIPLRVGRASNVWQIFLNRPRHQHRSRNERHEYEYNLDLLNGLGLEPPPITPALNPDPDLTPLARDRLARAGLGDVKAWFIHPGHGGSALNLPVERYVELVRALLARQIPVCVTFGPDEAHLAISFGEPAAGRLGFIHGLPDLAHLIALLALGRGWSGGSTGPMHLAAAVGLPVAAFFPPLPAMTPKRWGPVGRAVQVFLPAIMDCPGLCRTCSRHPCLANLDIRPAVEWISRHAL